MVYWNPSKRTVRSSVYSPVYSPLGAGGATADLFTGGILDESGQDNAAHLWGMRRCRLAYEGDLILQRRSSDNDELAIPPANSVKGKWDTDIMEAHAGAGEAYMVTPYDQVGSVDPTQASAGRQAKVVDSGTALASPTYDGIDDGYDGTGVSLSAYPYTMYSWAKSDTDANRTTLTFHNSGYSQFFYDIKLAGGTLKVFSDQSAARSVQTSSTMEESIMHLMASRAADDLVSAAIDDEATWVDTTSENNFTATLDLVQIGYVNGIQEWDGRIGENVVFKDNKTDAERIAYHTYGDPES